MDILAVYARRRKSTDDICQWTDTVHEDPEAWQCLWGLKDTGDVRDGFSFREIAHPLKIMVMEKSSVAVAPAV